MKEYEKNIHRAAAYTMEEEPGELLDPFDDYDALDGKDPLEADVREMGDDEKTHFIELLRDEIVSLRVKIAAMERNNDYTDKEIDGARIAVKILARLALKDPALEPKIKQALDLMALTSSLRAISYAVVTNEAAGE